MAMQKDWDKKAGKRMWEAGHGDADIAKAMGVTQGTISYFRRKHWEPERAAVEASQLPAPACQDNVDATCNDEDLNEDLNEDLTAAAEEAPIHEEIPVEDPVCVPDRNAEDDPKTPIQNEAAPKDLCSPDVSPSREGPGIAKTEDTDAGYQLLIRAREEATGNLTGMDAVMTAQIITALWGWTEKKELMEAKACLDYLIRRHHHV